MNLIRFSFILTLPILLVVTNIANADPLAGPSCELSIERPISFMSEYSHDKVTVSIGPGPCFAAKLKITLTSEENKVLYAYTAPFKKHVVDMWNDPNLPEIAKEFAITTAERGIVLPKDIPHPLPRNQVTEENPYELHVSRATYSKLLAYGQPIFHHLTYYEGGRYIAFNPSTNKTVVVIEWGY